MSAIFSEDFSLSRFQHFNSTVGESTATWVTVFTGITLLSDRSVIDFQTWHCPRLSAMAMADDEDDEWDDEILAKIDDIVAQHMSKTVRALSLIHI